MGSDTKELSHSISSLSLSTVAKRRMRTSKEEMAILEHYFSQNRNPNNEQKKEIAKAVQMTDKSVHFWFQNRRAKENKKNKTKGHHHQKKKSNGIKSSEQPSLAKQPQFAQEPPQKQEQQPTQPSFANVVGTSIMEKKEKPLTQLPPISSFNHYCNRPIGLDISYYFHHDAFGIEDSMRQWSDYHHDHQAHY